MFPLILVIFLCPLFFIFVVLLQHILVVPFMLLTIINKIFTFFKFFLLSEFLVALPALCQREKMSIIGYKLVILFFIELLID